MGRWCRDITIVAAPTLRSEYRQLHSHLQYYAATCNLPRQFRQLHAEAIVASQGISLRIVRGNYVVDHLLTQLPRKEPIQLRGN